MNDFGLIDECGFLIYSVGLLDEKDSSQNSFRSLSDAIRSSEVNCKLVQSEDVLRVTCQGVRTLRQDFTDANSMLREWVDETRANINDAKHHFGQVVDAKDRQIRDLEATAAHALTEHEQLVEQLNSHLTQSRQQVKELSASRATMESQRDSVAGELTAKLNKLKFDKEELGKLKEDGECQILQLNAETKRLRELYEQLQSDSQRRQSESQTIVETLQNDLQTLKLDKEAAIQSIRIESETLQRTLDETSQSRDTLQTECDELKSKLESAHESNDTLETRLRDTIESHRVDIEKRQTDIEDLEKCKQTLTDELSKVSSNHPSVEDINGDSRG